MKNNESRVHDWLTCEDYRGGFRERQNCIVVCALNQSDWIAAIRLKQLISIGYIGMFQHAQPGLPII